MEIYLGDQHPRYKEYLDQVLKVGVFEVSQEVGMTRIQWSNDRTNSREDIKKLIGEPDQVGPSR